MNTQNVLIIDDEPDIRELLEITLIRMGINTSSAASVAEAKLKLAEQNFQLCLTDMNLPDGNGIDLVAFIQQNYPDIPVAMITAYGSVETAISALKAGAFDFISKPVDLRHLRNMVSTALKLSENETTRSNAKTKNDLLIKGNTTEIKQLNKQILKLARSQAPIYISGESGSGKELVAKTIHQQGPRHSTGSFIPVNCGAIPNELVESEFFGHKKGSFSGAIEDKPGLFRAADGGTLFLDEVADLPLTMQVKLLRAIQEKHIRPVGEQKEIPIDVRILSATHKDLAQLVAEGTFRQDLFYRINVIKLDVPPLREHAGDIPLLANYFLGNISKVCNISDACFDQAAIDALSRYQFPGNVRELENIIERAFTLCDGNIIQVGDLILDGDPELPKEKLGLSRIAQEQRKLSEPEPEPEPESSLAPLQNTSNTPSITPRLPEQSLEDYLESIERQEIEHALNQTKWNRTAAAKVLGISFRALRYRLKKLEMD
ncbi:MAG: two-component system response regulator PilR (NtrC family) [Oleiphilaceae bacterium]|jgi:two-component system response regulator PilR (NtrC family)